MFSVGGRFRGEEGVILVIENSKAKTKKTQRVLNRLAERWREGHDKHLRQCRLGREPPSRRGGACSACKVKLEFELDKEVKRLIDKKTFHRPSACPYHVFSNNLLFYMTLGPEARRAQAGKPETIDPIEELNEALFHVAAVLQTTTLPPAHGEALYEDEEDEVKVLKLVASDIVRVTPQPAPGTRSRKGGRIGDLDIQAVTRAMVVAWRELTGDLPSKDNLSFRHLLVAASATVFSDLPHEPNWESATLTARQRILRDDRARRG
jgi:hypothetical protein